MADHSRLEREMLWVRVPPGPLRTSWRASGCGRRPLKAETVGSNPTQDTRRQGRQPADHLRSNRGMLWVRLPPLLLDVSAGHRRAQAAVTRPSGDCAGSTPARHTEALVVPAEWPPGF